MLLRQPPFVMIPVNVTGPWYSDRGFQVLEELRKALARPRRAVGLIIAGIVSLIALIAASATAAVSLSQSIQTAQYVNTLTHNVSSALGTQEIIDNKLEQKIDALYEMIMYLGEEVQGIKLRNSFKCHAENRWICVTDKKYNESYDSWQKVQQHLLGIWRVDNATKDLLQLHQEVESLKHAQPLEFDPAKTAEQIVNSFKEAFSPFGHLGDLIYFLISIGLAVAVVLVVLCILPYMIRKILSEFLQLKARTHELHLRSTPATYCEGGLRGRVAKDG